ncbi:MAG TPA: M1 family aminopeptidase [Planctomycetota bacterium]|nr:M1 family aminopeptidase [Planctomycetota bacterium]
MFRPSARIVATYVPFLLAAQVLAQEPKRSDRFSGPPRDPPSRDFDFVHLRLECAFDWEREKVEGKVTHTIQAMRDGIRILELDSVDIEVLSAATSDGRALSFDTMPGKLRVDLGREARRGEEQKVTLSYQALPKQGVYFRKPSKDDPETPRQIWTQGEAEEARHWIPCFDHPSDKLTTEILVTAPRPLIAVSNGKLLSTEPRGDSGQVFHWLQDKPHTTYLIAVVIGEFATWKGDADGIPLTGYVSPKHAHLAARSFELTADMAAFFAAKTGVPYPWARYDQLCVSGFPFGGMENTTATILTENTLHDERAALDVSSMGLVAHELAHQWFGNLVTCKDWGDIWLNESFATFFANLYAEHHLGWDEGVYDRHEDGEAYKAEDRNEYRRRLSTRSWRRPENLFDRHAYPKGARVLSMLRFVLGDAPFFAGIKHYLEKHAFQPVETTDFRVAMEEATGMSLGWFFDEWVYSGGHPSYRVTSAWNPEISTVSIDVEQTQKVDDLTPLFRMPIVLSITQPSGRTERRVWVSERKHTFSFPAVERPRLVRFDPGDWILKDLELEKSREELMYQLREDPDVMGRREAAAALKKLLAHASALGALLERLETEPFWGVRLEIVSTLAGAAGEDVMRCLTARLWKEPKARVRREIVRALGELAGSGASPVLREVIARDLSYFVAADALRALGKVERRGAHADAIAALERDSHDEVIRAAAVDVLAMDETVEGEERTRIVRRLMEVAGPGSPRLAKAAALRALPRIGKGDDEVFRFLTAALDDGRLPIRMSAVRALGELGDRRALPALEALKAKEKPIVLRSPIDTIQAAIARIEGRTDFRALQDEVRSLRERNEKLEARLGAIERRAVGRSF